MENLIKIHDLGVPLFLETPIYIYICIYIYCHLSIIGHGVERICQNLEICEPSTPFLLWVMVFLIWGCNNILWRHTNTWNPFQVTLNVIIGYYISHSHLQDIPSPSWKKTCHCLVQHYVHIWLFITPKNRSLQHTSTIPTPQNSLEVRWGSSTFGQSGEPGVVGDMFSNGIS